MSVAEVSGGLVYHRAGRSDATGRRSESPIQKRNHGTDDIESFRGRGGGHGRFPWQMTRLNTRTGTDSLHIPNEIYPRSLCIADSLYGSEVHRKLTG